MKVENNHMGFQTEKSQYNNKCNIQSGDLKETTKDTPVRISEESKKKLEEARRKALELKNEDIFSSIPEDIQEIPASYRIENLFKIELNSEAIDGGCSPFVKHAEEQYKIFNELIDEKGEELSEEEMDVIKKEIKEATGAMDYLNSQEGYRGSSFESILFCTSSVAALKNIKEKFLPDSLKEDFQKLISEYEHFNINARDSIMQRMTPDYMVIGIGSEHQSYLYKEEIIGRERDFYQEERGYLENKFSSFYDDKADKQNIVNDIEKYMSDYFMNKHQYYSEPDGGNQNINDLIDMLKNTLNVKI